MIGDIGDPRVADAVGSLFGRASHGVRGNINESFGREELGERATREETYTDSAVRLMRHAIAAGLEEIGGRFRELGVGIEIDFSPTQLPISEETRYGADIGIRTTIRTSGAVVVKGILIQCKRMYRPIDNPSYPELRGRGERQARDMLRITPASFFMLFNAGDQRTLVDYTLPPSGMLCPVEGFGPIPERFRNWRGRNCKYWAESDGSIWDMGICILPASHVLALSAAARISRTQIPVDGQTILRGCLPLGVFMVDLFASCFVGDPRDNVVRIVTAPELRSQNPPMGLTDSDFDDFAVRHHINISITREG